jgi:flagellar hook-associated protein 1
MPSLFDGYRVSVSGLNAHRTLMEVVGNNIAHASDKNYSRQEATLGSNGVIQNGQGHIYGLGVKVESIQRIRDELLDKQLRDTSSSANNYSSQYEWMRKIENIFNDPSENSLNNSLGEYWESWSQLSSSPEDYSTRTNLITKTQRLADLIQNVHQKLSNLEQESEEQLAIMVNSVNGISEEIAQLNKNIFEIEAGQSQQANDLRDQRDAALDSLSEYLDISYSKNTNGMVNVYVDSHPIVLQNNAEKMLSENDPSDTSKIRLVWEYGEIVKDPSGGSLSGILSIRDKTIPSYLEELNTFTSLLIEKTNDIYSSGVGLDPLETVQSNLGYTSLGVSSSSEILDLLPEGESASIYISFYDSNDNFERSESIIVNSDDSLDDIQEKLNNISDLNAELLTSSDVQLDGRLMLSLDNSSTSTGFSVTKQDSSDDTSGFLNLLGFNSTQKSKDIPPILNSSSLDDLATSLNVSINDISTTDLNLQGSFNINAFETVTPSSTQTGYNILQLSIDVESTDTLQDITNKINSYTSSYGLLATIDTANDIFSITSSMMTDDEGNFSTTGTNSVALSFTNLYDPDTYSNDEPPTNYTGSNDEVDLFSTMQLNTFFQGTDSSNIDLDTLINSSSLIHAGYELGSGNNSLAIDMVNLQNSYADETGQFTIDQKYQNIISQVGNDTKTTEQLANNDQLMLEGFLSEKDSISGVNLDEELAKMILYQRSYEANARFLTTIDEMVEELIRSI